MDGYYQRQAQLPYFGGHIRQRGSGIGALVAGVGRVALPFVRNVVWPAAKRFGKELVSQGLPEAIDALTKKQTPRQAIKKTLRKTIQKQVGGAGRRRRRSLRIQSRQKRATTSSNKSTRKRKASNTIPLKNSAKRSRLNFFSNIDNDY